MIIYTVIYYILPQKSEKRITKRVQDLTFEESLA